MRLFVLSLVLAVFGIFGIILGVFHCSKKRSDPPNIEFWVGRDYAEFKSIYGATENFGSGMGIFYYEFSGRTFLVWVGDETVLEIREVTENGAKDVKNSKSLHVGC